MAEGNKPPPPGSQPGSAPPPPLPAAPPLGRPPPRPPPPLLGTRPPAPPSFLGTRPPPPARPCPLPMEPHPPLFPPAVEPSPPLPPAPPAVVNQPPLPSPKATDSHDDGAKSQDQSTDQTESKNRELPAAKDRVGKVKMGFGVLGKRAAPMSGISIKMKPQGDGASKKAKTEPIANAKPSSKLVAQAFGSDSEEEEEMPPEAKMRMRNIGKDTPTSAGPNSFYKSAKGFTDPRASWRNELEKD